MRVGSKVVAHINAFNGAYNIEAEVIHIKGVRVEIVTSNGKALNVHESNIVAITNG